ncbi:guanitoxin biosynthesis PLP-dependent (S)-gamma-hydroxy-L-arginine cyclodehydratase GntC [Cohnella faecalis]|uniref:Aminotransferase n=1 Tax=Cohnella faecalis TaxID=2315694 RepID=A0A398CUK2_9BACL|nr:guanitoxin biosynthesis PLP-dependent (S)-gamma-hydroxy-L-arginine cyclodehydratase GntC [Cohnella faecalis]RIE03537.1 aminotransferase class I/II-fold pyridoxal phosphate-dependent enzyme [Cohnella faecalis]
MNPMSMNEHLSETARTLPPSGIRRFFDLAGASKDLISLGVGEPDFVTPEHVRQACIQALENGRTAYTPNSGLPELRQAIADYLKEGFRLEYEPSCEMMITVGSSEAIDLALRALIAPGDEIIVPVPTYIAYAPIAALHGGRVVELETSARDGFKLTAASLREKITSRTKAIILNFPNNPTGAIMTREDWIPVAQLIREHNLIVIADEIYAELTYEGRHVSIASLPGMQERTLLVSGFSKAFAMTGWRVGYVCGHRDLIGAMLKIHQYTVMCAPVIGQIAAVESLKQAGLEEMKYMIRSYDQRRRMFVEGLRRIGLPCREPQGAFYAFPSIAHTGLTSDQFAERLMNEAGVATVPGNVFGPGGEGFIRCTYASSVAKLTEALERMERFLARIAEERESEVPSPDVVLANG